jgi:assimilatory nitrate reductase catalytic subunit
MKKVITSAKALLLNRHGTLTKELTREPGGFGLGQVPSRLKPDSVTTAVCGFCSTGCGLDVHLKDGQAINLSPAKDYSVNLGMACPKGWEALTPLAAPDRATHPLLRNAAGRLERVSWSGALEAFVRNMRAVQAKHGPESCAFISTGQIPTEEMFVLGALAKFGLGMVHGDGNTRQCMATAVTAYKQSFGFDAPPYTYADFEESDVIFLIGSNLCIAHPIMWERICQNPHDPEIVVVDPRQTETAMAATRHLGLAPKSDLWFFYGLAHILLREGWIDREFVAAHVSGLNELTENLESFTPERVAAETGLSVQVLEETAALIHGGKRVSFWWTMGVNQSHEGVRVAQAIINLALLTGNIGRPGTGANSITGQCNAMGSRLFSNTTNLMGGHTFESAADRAKIAQILELDERRIPRQSSLAYDQILEGIRSGKIRALWVVATNTSHSWIHQSDAKELLSQLDFLVVQDMYHSTETAAQAHLVLPAAGWGEKEGTFINSERRIALLKKVSRAPGEALADFYIFKLVAEAWGGLDFMRRFETPEDAFRAMTACSRGQPCDITGISGYDQIEAMRGIQWPLAEGQTVERRAERRLFEDGEFFTSDRKAKLVFETPRPMPEKPDADYPLLLLTGRGTSAQWHTQTRTSKSDVLRKLYSQEAYVEIHPDDAARRDISSDDWVIVESRRGSMRARAFVTSIVSAGQVFIPMHYAETNLLTYPSVDPYSRQPSYKASAVRIRIEDQPKRPSTRPRSAKSP